MMNNVILVGRIIDIPEDVKLEDDRIVTRVIISVNRNYKNEEGVYDTDIIPCILWNKIAETTTEYCKVGDVIGVKGRLQSTTLKDKDENNVLAIQVVAERVTFLSNKDKHREDENAR